MKIKKIKLLFILIFVIFLILPLQVNAMSLKTYDFYGNQKIIEVESSDTIEIVKDKIGLNEGKTVEDTIIVLDGNELENGRTLSDYSVSSTDVIYMLGDYYYTLNANGGIIGDGSSSQTKYLVPHYYYYIRDYNFDSIIPKKDGYAFKDWYTKSDGGYPFIYYVNRVSSIEITEFYAQWDVEGTVTINLTNVDDWNAISGWDQYYLRFLESKGKITIDNETLEVKNEDGLLLFILENSSSQLQLATGLNTKNNIVYTLSQTDKEKIEADGVSIIPNKIELIVSTKEVYKVIFNANEGTFKNDIKTIDIEDIINFNYETFEKPTREGYKFIGFYTKNGKSYYDVMNSEAGIEEDITFYAQWQEISYDEGQAGISEGGEQEDNNAENTSQGNTSTGNTNTDNTNTNKPTGNNPQTGDNIMLFVINLVVSIIGITATPRIRKK